MAGKDVWSVTFSLWALFFTCIIFFLLRNTFLGPNHYVSDYIILVVLLLAAVLSVGASIFNGISFFSHIDYRRPEKLRGAFVIGSFFIDAAISLFLLYLAIYLAYLS